MKTLLLFTLFFFTLSQFTPPNLPLADFSGPGQIFHPQTGKCLSHALGVAEIAGSVVTLSLQPCEGEFNTDGVTLSTDAQKVYRRTIWKFKRFVISAAAADINGPEALADSVFKAYILPFSNAYGPSSSSTAGSGNFVLGSDGTSLKMLETSVANLLGVWDVTYKNSNNKFLGNYFTFNPYFYLKMNPVAAITDATTLATSTSSLTVASTGNIQVNFKSVTSGTTITNTLPLETPTTVTTAVSVPFTSMFVFRKVGLSVGDGAPLKDTFVFKKDIDVAQFAGADGNDDRLSFILGLDVSVNDAKKKGIHTNGFFSLQGPNPANNISALCTTKYNTPIGFSWDFYESYDFTKKELRNLFVPPLDDNTPTGAIRIVASAQQLLACGFLKKDRVETNKTNFLVDSWVMEGKVGYVDTNTRAGFYWNVIINLNDQLNDNRIYLDNPESHYWFFDATQELKIPSFGRINVFNVNATDLKPLANGAAVSTSVPATVKDPYKPINDDKEIFVRDYLVYQLALQNIADNYTITNLKAYVVQRRTNPSTGLVEDLGGLEIPIKDAGKAANIYNFTLPLEKVPTGEYKLLLQYNIASTTSKRILAEEDRRVIKTEAGSTVMGLKIVNDALAGEWMRFLGVIAAILALVFMA